MSLPFRKPHIWSAYRPASRVRVRGFSTASAGGPGGHRGDGGAGRDVQLLAQQRGREGRRQRGGGGAPARPGATGSWIVLGSSRGARARARASISRLPLTDASQRPGTEIEIAGRTAAVTGAGGFIGGAVCRALAEAGASEVVGIDVSRELDERVRAAGADPARGERDRPRRDRGRARRRRAGRPHRGGRPRVRGDAGLHRGQRPRARPTSSTPPRRRAPSGSLHVSSVVVYGYADERHQDESATRRAVGIPYIDTKSASDRLAARRGAVIVRPGRRVRPRVGPLDRPPGRADAPRAPGPAGQGRRDDAARLHRRPGRAGSWPRCAAASPARPTRSGTASPVPFQRYFELLAAEVPGATAAAEPPEGAAARGGRRHRGGRQAARPDARLRPPRRHPDRPPRHGVERPRTRGARVGAPRSPSRTASPAAASGSAPSSPLSRSPQTRHSAKAAQSCGADK